MSIYWSKATPKNAQFLCYRFGETSPTQIRQRITRLPPPTQPIQIIEKKFLPDKELWMANMKKALEAIKSGSLGKVVLARCCSLVCKTPPNPLAITASLVRKARKATVFCVIDENKAFLGATPEILFSRKGRIIQAEALAGTVPRGKTKKEDLLLKNQLFSSRKIKSEVLFVIDYLQNELSSLCKSPLNTSPIFVRKTPNVQHLCSSLQGVLHPSITDDEIVKKLHPTPALCGFPKKDSFDWIQRYEPFRRDLYGGVLGWWTKEESTFAVGIRSCLIQERTVQLFTGAGIVAKSNPDHEWEELNIKMNLYQDIFYE